MQKQTSPIKPPKNQVGFTLIEVMLVVVIVGFMAGMAILAIGGNQQRNLQNDVNRLQQLLKLAQTRASFEQHSLGFRLVDNGYEFMSYQLSTRQWHTIEDKQLRPRQFEAPTQLELMINGVALSLKAREKSDLQSDENLEKEIPNLLILANGEMSAFELRLKLQIEPAIEHRLFSDGFSSVQHELIP